MTSGKPWQTPKLLSCGAPGETRFAENENGGNLAVGVWDNAEQEMIDSIDQQNWSADKLLAYRFIDFLGFRRLTMKTLKLLPAAEQQRLKVEFLGG